MMRTLATFAALSMAGTVILSLLPEGSMKRTAGMAIGLLTLLCWAESISSLLGLEFTLDKPDTALVPTAYSMDIAAFQALSALEEASP